MSEIGVNKEPHTDISPTTKLKSLNFYTNPAFESPDLKIDKNIDTGTLTKKIEEKNEKKEFSFLEVPSSVDHNQEIRRESIIFSPIISSQIDTISQHRSSIISTAIIERLSLKGGKNSILRRYAGVIFALFATLIYSLATLTIKVFGDYHPFTVSLWRFQGLIFPTIPVLFYHIFYEKKPILATVWPLTNKKILKNVFYITLRSVVGCTSTVLQIFALQYLTMADASVIVFSSPVFVLFVARIFLGEKAGYFSIVIAIFTLIGVGIICRPPMLTGEPMEAQNIIGIGFALGCMLTGTLIFVILRYLKEVHYAVVTFCYGVEGSIGLVILSFSFGVFELPRTGLEWGLLCALIIFTWGGQTCLILALQLEQCGVVSLINSLDTCFAFILQFIFLGVVPDMYSLTGASIVVAGVIITTFRKYLSTLPEDHETRKRFGILLK